MNGVWNDFRGVMQANRVFEYSVAALPFWLLGQIARDWLWLTALWFYIPSALLATSLAGCSLYYAARRRWKMAAVAGCLGIAPIGVVVFLDNHVSRPGVSSPGTGHVRLVHWNVASRLNREGVQEKLLAQRADLYVLSEIPDAAAVEALRAKLGEQYRSQVFGNLAVIAVGRVHADGWFVDRHRTKVQKLTWEHEGHVARLFVVDLPSEIHVARDPLLREINRLIDEHRPDLIVGDFNAPRRSWGLCDLPEGYRHAYDSAGSGCGYTWPVPFPMYAIDQCVHSSRIVPSRYELHSTMHSDHRVQVFEFGWK